MRNRTLPVKGERFGRWTVTGVSRMRDSGHRIVLCDCDCGTQQEVLVFALRSGKSLSCGCLKKELAAKQARRQWTTHGRAKGPVKDPLYLLWKRINRRCHNPEAHNYRWYGARGISVWGSWRTDAGAFIEYIEKNLGSRPDGMSLDRIDNYGNYEPGNLRWATQLEQVRNSRNNRSLS